MPATKDELIDFAIRSGAPLEVVENLQELSIEGEIYESIEEIWPDYPTKEDFFFNEDEENLLRIREDAFIGDHGEITDVRYRLTLIGAASEREFEGSVILSRSRFIAPSNHTPRFYREYFKPRRELEIEKDRLRWLVVFNGIEFFINIDRLIDPKIGTYVEAKSRTWGLHDAATKAALAADVMEILGATPESLIADDYVDLVEQD